MDKVELRNNFSRDHRGMLVVIFIIQLIILSFLLIFVTLQYNHKPKPVYFNVNNNNQLIDPVSIDKSIMSIPALLNWTMEGVLSSYRFNYRSLATQISRLEPYFDERGFKSYFKFLMKDPNMKLIKPQKLVVSAKALGAPEVVKDGLIEGRFGWLIKVPIMVTFENITVLIREKVIVEVFVWRVPETDSPIGLRITQFKSTIEKRYKAVPRAGL